MIIHLLLYRLCCVLSAISPGSYYMLCIIGKAVCTCVCVGVGGGCIVGVSVCVCVCVLGV